MAGANASRTLNGSFAGLPMQTTLGVQTRYDAIDLALTGTFQRSFLSNVRSDKVGEGSVGVYAQNTSKWTDWLKTTIGWRGDYYQARVNSIFEAHNSGEVGAGIGSPKFTAVVGPFSKTEFFVGAGYGMHSNDARGATITEDPTDPAMKLSASPRSCSQIARRPNRGGSRCRSGTADTGSSGCRWSHRPRSTRVRSSGRNRCSRLPRPRRQSRDSGSQAGSDHKCHWGCCR